MEPGADPERQPLKKMILITEMGLIHLYQSCFVLAFSKT
jgi:hypothetical protein